MEEKINNIMENKIIHTFLYYDMPLYFISISPSQQLFLNYFIEEDENGDDLWLHAIISKQELDLLTNFEISTYGLLNKVYSESRLFYLKCLHNEDYKEELNLINEQNLNLEFFPKETFVISYDYKNKVYLEKKQPEFITEIIEEPISVKSSRFKLIFKDAENSHDIPFDLLLNSLNQFRKTMFSLANDINKKIDSTAKNIFLKMKVEAMPPSSFGVNVLIEQEDLFELPDETLSKLMGFMDTIEQKNPADIKISLENQDDYSLKTIKEINNLFQDIKKSKYSFGIQAESSNNEVKKVTFDDTMYEKLEVITEFVKHTANKKEIEKIVGNLITINAKRNYFSIETDERIYTGRIETSLFKKIKAQEEYEPFNVPSPITATIEIEKITDILGEVITEKYVLTDYEQ